MNKTTIQAADVQAGDCFAGGQVHWIAVGAKTVTVRFDDGQTAYYDRSDTVTILRKQDDQ